MLSRLNETGYWLAPLGYGSHPFTRQGSMTFAPGDYSRTHVGDETDTSPLESRLVSSLVNVLEQP